MDDQNQQRTAWYIYEYPERLEITEDKRQQQGRGKLKGLSYIQVPVDCASDSGAHMEDLEYEDNYCELLGAYVALARRASCRTRPYRGFLLVGPYRPAVGRHIENWLHMNRDQAKTTMATLERIGLVVRRPLPALWNNPEKTGPDELAPGSAEHSEVKTGTDFRPDPTSAEHGHEEDIFFNKHGTPENSGELRNTPENSVTFIDKNRHRQSELDNPEIDKMGTAPEQPGAEQSPQPSPDRTATATTAQAPQGALSSSGAAEACPPAQTPQGLVPTIADAPGPSGRLSGSRARASKKKYSADGEMAAGRILMALDYRPATGNDHERQRANFAHWWDGVVQKVGTEGQHWILTEALKKAGNPQIRGKGVKYYRKCLKNLLPDWNRKAKR